MANFLQKLKKYISNCLLITVMANQVSFGINVDDIISKMSFEEKLGQIMCLDVRFWNSEPVTELNLDIKNILSKYSIGNIILFSQNFKDKFQSQKLDVY